MNRSWPFLAETSDAARVFRSTRLMLSTVTVVLFFWPHSTTYFLLNHSSHAGTKWLHCRIFRVFCWAAARSGNKNAVPIPAAAAEPTPAIFMKSLRETPCPFFFAMISPPSTSGWFQSSHELSAGPIMVRRSTGPRIGSGHLSLLRRPYRPWKRSGFALCFAAQHYSRIGRQSPYQGRERSRKKALRARRPFGIEPG